jgi:FkbM family methyltransferase
MTNIINDNFIAEIKKSKRFNFVYDIKPDVYNDLVSIGFVFTFQGNKTIVATFNGIKVTIKSFDELFILHEIYYKGVYNYSFTTNHVVIDVGMNVGFASLFFALASNVSKVISFEPIKFTFQQGVNNFTMNPILNKKITAHNLGLGNANKNVEYLYEIEWKGSAGIRNNHVDLSWKQERFKKQIVNIVDIIEIVENAKRYSMPIVVKMDCEGSEFEIIEQLKVNSKLRDIDFYMIEFHDTSPDSLIECFNYFGFITITNNPHFIDSTGMIYAFKK